MPTRLPPARRVPRAVRRAGRVHARGAEEAGQARASGLLRPWTMRRLPAALNPNVWAGIRADEHAASPSRMRAASSGGRPHARGMRRSGAASRMARRVRLPLRGQHRLARPRCGLASCFPFNCARRRARASTETRASVGAAGGSVKADGGAAAGALPLHDPVARIRPRGARRARPDTAALTIVQSSAAIGRRARCPTGSGSVAQTTCRKKLRGWTGRRALATVGSVGRAFVDTDAIHAHVPVVRCRRRVADYGTHFSVPGEGAGRFLRGDRKNPGRLVRHSVNAACGKAVCVTFHTTRSTSDRGRPPRPRSPTCEDAA
ncbi:hypothetical protein BPA30113_00899 [Burkholderia paludis]|uniref:Uncharacterized protein n=1 Tax=Burkholderia paludis TaxID=1506587 RepID=A0A6J5CZC6_9BURK|nr:hypothetical protein LMG30113_00214 [Burkholderia paludis]VWB25231.1 hypothetical protein BPA30113_00899 [Burkholderia paludis]